MKALFSYIINLYFRLTFIRQLIWSLIIFCILTVFGIFFFQNSQIFSKPIGWEKKILVSSPKIFVKNVKVASKGNFIVVVYEGREGDNAGIYVSVSINGGVSFLPTIKIADFNSKINNNPYVAISGKGLVTVTWYDFIEKESTNRIYYSTSTDMGANWTKPVQLVLGYKMEMLPRIYFDNKGILHLFFHAHKDGIFHLFHAISTDRKKFNTIKSLIVVEKNMKGAFFPAIHLAGRNIFIVWQGKLKDYTDDLFFMKSSDYGKRWSSIRKITKSKASDASPSILMHKDILYLVYQNNAQKNWGIRLLKGQKYGEDWEEESIKITDTNANCYSPKLVISKNDLLIVWYDVREKKSKVFSRKYSISNGELSPEQKLTLGNYSAKNPTAFSVGEKAVVFWEESSKIMAKYTDVHVEPPVLFSLTHKKEKWSRLPVARITWKPPRDASGIVGYATMISRPSDLDRSIDVDPVIQNIRASITSKVISELEDGVTYFHIRAIDGAGNFSRTIHYPIKVSINPLSAPVVVSPTHPERRPVDKNSPVFRWAVDDTERLKGFVYSISKDTPVKPDNFITDFEMKFDNLAKGEYYFTLRAVDKLNQQSKERKYNFIITREGGIELVSRREVSKISGLEINFPFDASKAYASDEFRALIVTRNIPPESIAGYSVYINNTKREVPERINLKNNIINVMDLKNGDYYIGAKCKYYRIVRGRRKYYWTSPFYSKILIEVPGERSPIEYYAKTIIDKLSNRAGIATLTLLGLILSVLTFGYGVKLVFYFKLLSFRVKVLFRLMI